MCYMYMLVQKLVFKKNIATSKLRKYTRAYMKEQLKLQTVLLKCKKSFAELLKKEKKKLKFAEW